MTAYRSLIVLAVLSSLSVLAGSLLAPVEARYIQSITDNPALTGTVFGVGSVVFAALSFWMGRLSDRYGRRRILLLGLAVGIGYALFYSFAFNILQLYGVKFAWAFSAAATGPVLAATLQDLLSGNKHKGKYFGYVYSLESISGSAGALAGGAIAEWYGLSMPFVVLAALYAAMLCLAIGLFPRSAVSPYDTPAVSPPVLEIFRFVFTKPELLFYLSLNVSSGINWGIKVFLWPLAIFAIAGSDLVIGSIFATMGVVAFVLLPFAGRIVDRFGPFRVSFFQYILLGSTGVALALVDSLVWFWALAAVYTIGEVLNVTQAVLFTEYVPNHIRGAVMGLDEVIDKTLAAVAPLAAGLLVTALGVSLTLALFMSLYWVSVVVAAFIYFTRIRPAA